MSVSASVSAAPLILGIPEDASARLAFSRRAGSRGDSGGEGGTGSVSLTVGVDPAQRGEPLVARARLAAAVGLQAGDVVYASQVHGAGVAIVGRTDRGRGARHPDDAVPGVDALVTTEEGVGLAVLAADCVPLLLVAPGRAVAAAHAGRRGLVVGVVPATLEALAAATAPTGSGDVAAVVAVVGPAIRGCCYELPEAVVDEIVTAHPEARATTTWGTPSIDVAAGVIAQLRGAGIARVEHLSVCTACNGCGWFSARASASTTLGRPAPTGRHAGIVCRSSTPLTNYGSASARHSP